LFDIFVKDLQTGAIVRASTNSAGEGAIGGDNGWPSLSADGRYVLFNSGADNLVPGDTNGWVDVFVKDLLTGAVELISSDAFGGQADGNSLQPTMSTDGRFVVFSSDSSNLVEGDTSATYDTFVKDRHTGAVMRASTNAAGEGGNEQSSSGTISDDGRFVVFSSYASNLVPDDTNEVGDVFVKDLYTGAVSRLTSDAVGAPADGDSNWVLGSSDGRYVSFYSVASNLVSDDVNNVGDVFLATVNFPVESSLASIVTELGDNSPGENETIHTLGAALAFHDVDIADTHSISVNPAGSGYRGDFSAAITNDATGDGIGTVSWTFSVADSALDDLAAGENLTQNYLLTLSDGEGGEDSRQISVRLIGVNDSPASTDDSVTVAEDTIVTLTANDFGLFSDVDGDAIAAVRIVSPPSAGSLQHHDGNANGVWAAVIVDQDVSAADIVQGRLRFVPEDNESGMPYATIGFRVNDGTDLSESAYALNVNVSAVSDAPQFNISMASASIVRASTDAASAQAHATSDDDGNSVTAISADGRFVAFRSWASNLVPDDNNGTIDVFVKDMHTGAIKRASTTSSWEEASGSDYFVTGISADGRYVAFGTDANDLVTNDTNGGWDVFVKDMESGLIVVGNTSAAGDQAGGHSNWPTLSADGRYVAFHNSGGGGVLGGGGDFQVYVKDLQSGAVVQASTDAFGVGATGGESSSPWLSADGRYVAFFSRANNLVPGDTNGEIDSFVKDLHTGAIERVSTTSSGGEVFGLSDLPRLSADGRYVVFYSNAEGLVPGDNNETFDTFVKDRETGVIVRASTTATGEEADGFSHAGTISADGRYVVFFSYATNLVPDDNNELGDVFVKDLHTGAITRLSNDASLGEADGWSYWSFVSADGRYAVFNSEASNLVADDTNGVVDVFVAPTSPIASPLMRTATEIADGAAGENATSHSVGASLAFSDVDLADSHTVNFSPVGGGYLGAFSAGIANDSTGDGAGNVEWSFSIADLALDELAMGETLTQVYTLTLDDGNGGTDALDVTVRLVGVNDAPVAADDSFTMPLDEPLLGNVLADNGSGADSDVDDDLLSVIAETIGTAQGGTVAIEDDGSFAYTPASGFTGDDSFDYTLLDGHGGQDVGTVSILV
jgi:VCBS repeat-containing protein